MSDTHPLPPRLEQDPQHDEYIPQDQVDLLKSTIEELTEKLHNLQLQVGVRSMTGEMTSPFTPSLKVAKTIERLYQTPQSLDQVHLIPQSTSTHFRTIKTPPSGVTKV